MKATAISHTRFSPEIGPNHFEPERLLTAEARKALSLVVKGEAGPAGRILRPSRTIAEYRNGLSVAERRLMSEAVHFMRSRRRPLVWLTLEDHEAGELALRNLADRLKSDFGQMQRRADGPRYSLEVLESTHALHSNIIGLVPVGLTVGKVVDRLEASAVFGANVNGQLVRNPDGLVKYLSKEATTQAHFAAGRSFRRSPGSHPLGEGGGDRVRPSRDLYRDMIDAGATEPRKRTYRVRSLKPPQRGLSVGETQLSLFPTMTKPVARLHDYGHGIASPSVALEIEFRRKQAGMTQAQLARRAGISRPQLTNAIQGRFGLAAWSASRLREALAA